MRLIDADALIEYIRNRKFSGEARWGDFEDVVDDFPTAYDVETVVAELESIKTGGDCRNKCKYYDWSVGWCEGHCEDYVREKAIEIVRGKEQL